MVNEDKQLESTPTPHKIKMRSVGRLDNIASIREEMAILYRQAKKSCNGKITPTQASKLSFILTSIGKFIMSENLEKRVEELEQRLGMRIS